MAGRSKGRRVLGDGHKDSVHVEKIANEDRLERAYLVAPVVIATATNT